MGETQRILIDATMARGGGGYTYAVNIIPRLLRHLDGCHFRVLLRSRRLFAELSACADHPRLELDLLPDVGLLGRLRFSYLDSVRVAKAWKADVYFSVGESVPLHGPFARIASFRNPAVFTPLEEAIDPLQRRRLKVLRAVCQLSARSAHQVMFVSDDSARWIGDQVGLAQERRFVNHHGIDPTPWRRAAAQPIPFERPYILSAGALYRYKNFVRLVEAFEELVRRTGIPHDLVVIGDTRQEPDTYHEVLAAREKTGALARRIHVMGEVPYEDMPGFYAHADLFVFPSFLETFGHPLLEAMACGVPVVASDMGVFREVAGDAALYSDPFDPSSFAHAMGEALLGFGVAEALVKRGREVVNQFTWDRTALNLSNLFDSALRVRESGRLRNRVPQLRAA